MTDETKRSPSSESGTRMLSSYERSRIIRTLSRKQEGICGICGGELGTDKSIDHILPVSAGGKNVWSNYRITHLKCNRVRGADKKKDPKSKSTGL